MKAKLFFICVLALLVTDKINAQEFPEIWDYSSYDTSRGKKGALRIINYDGQSTPFENKAFIFATSILQSGVVNDKDLFRLTCRGVSTLNSPFEGYAVKLNFCTRESFQGSISGSQSVLRIEGKDKLALGTEKASDILNILPDYSLFANDIKVDHSAITMHFGLNDARTCGWVGTRTNNGWELGANGGTAMYIGNGRNIFLGFNQFEAAKISSTLKETYNVFVKKGILSVDYAIAPIATWSDFVFDKDYKLKPLDEVERYIENNGHLPEVPSTEDVKENGYSQHAINKVLLQKIEELTLYVIQQEKEITRLKEQLLKNAPSK